MPKEIIKSTGLNGFAKYPDPTPGSGENIEADSQESLLGPDGAPPPVLSSPVLFARQYENPLPFPPEIWIKVLSRLSSLDLMSVRRVCGYSRIVAKDELEKRDRRAKLLLDTLRGEGKNNQAISNALKDIEKLPIDELDVACGPLLDNLGAIKSLSPLHVTHLLSIPTLSRTRYTSNVDFESFSGIPKSVIYYMKENNGAMVKGFEKLWKRGEKAYFDLVASGCFDVNQPDGQQQLPIHFAIGSSNDKLLHELVKAGAKIDPHPEECDSGLAEAIANGSEPRALRLIDMLFRETGSAEEKMNTLNRCDSRGRTPLHAAALFGFSGLIEKLINKGADINARNVRGETVLDITENLGPYRRQQIVDKLRALGAKTGAELDAQN